MYSLHTFDQLQLDYASNSIDQGRYIRELEYIVTEIKNNLEQDNLTDTPLYEKIIYTTNPNNSDMKGPAKKFALESIIQLDLVGNLQRA